MGLRSRSAVAAPEKLASAGYRPQLLESLKEEFADVLNNNELPAGRPPAGRPMRRMELVEGAAPSFVPRYRGPPQHEEEMERQVDELLKKGKIQAT